MKSKAGDELWKVIADYLAEKYGPAMFTPHEERLLRSRAYSMDLEYRRRAEAPPPPEAAT